MQVWDHPRGQVILDVQFLIQIRSGGTHHELEKRLVWVFRMTKQLLSSMLLVI